MRVDSCIIEGNHYLTGCPTRIRMDGGVIQDIQTLTSSTPLSNWIAPGLVDLQVNGYGGQDFNEANLSPNTVQSAVQQLWSVGVTECLPTLITNDPETILHSLQVIRTVLDRDERIARSVPGIHVEGPFLSPLDGPRGAHDAKFIRPPDWTLFERWQAESGNRICLITLSPEYANASDFIARCVASGVKVAIGHTAANSAEIESAVAAGATLSTHLGNGAHALLRRHPNYIWDQLANDSLWTSFIGDGFHLPDSVVKVIRTVKGEKAFLVSDTVMLAGMEAGEYETPVGGAVVLTTEGRLHLKQNSELLAGSAMPLVSAVQTVQRRQSLHFSEAWDLGSVRPAQFMGYHSSAGLAIGAPANLVELVTDGEGKRISRTFVHGEVVFSSEPDHSPNH